MNSSIDGICKLCSKEEMASSKLRDSRRFKAPSLNAEKWEMEQEQEQEQEQQQGRLLLTSSLLHQSLFHSIPFNSIQFNNRWIHRSFKGKNQQSIQCVLFLFMDICTYFIWSLQLIPSGLLFETHLLSPLYSFQSRPPQLRNEPASPKVLNLHAHHT